MSRSVLSIVQVIIVLVVVAILAVVIGGATGWFIGQRVFETEQLERLGMSPDDLLLRLREIEGEYQALYEHCEPLEGSERDMLINAQERVENLRTEIEDKQAEIASLEVKARQNAALRKELEQRKEELAQLENALTAAEQEREELVERLELAVEEVSVARAEARQAKSETMVVKWEEFKANAMLEICERGTKGKIEKCRGVVEAALTYDRERRFRECVRQGAAVPQLREIEKDEALPAYAEWVWTESRITKDWYILFCDPTLPEAGGGRLQQENLEELDEPLEDIDDEELFELLDE